MGLGVACAYNGWGGDAGYLFAPEIRDGVVLILMKVCDESLAAGGEGGQLSLVHLGGLPAQILSHHVREARVPHLRLIGRHG